ncbi:MAG: signal recognition particle-docking protein FtsY [Planctomycetes bacterium]|nr:signal recognition particle-docking protein FtsY [Planctomycetota bacterium]NOG53867.1 signal recognition particle-docking protein FtsY [Planctomycetota bacterium]
MGLFKSTFDVIRKGLTRTRETFAGGLRSLLAGRALSNDVIDELEAALIQADVGVQTSVRLIEHLREEFKEGRIKKGDEVLEFLKNELKSYWPEADRRINLAEKKPTVILVAGINGSGKTTSVAKIAKNLRDGGQTVLLAAADTFRAGAVHQLTIWAERLGVEIIRGQQNADPAAVAFDACEAALARGVDVLLIDTAGRLHTQHPLMRQLIKIRDVVARKIPGAPHEVLLVLDATTGQNAIEQARQFSQAVDVTGIFLAKLDGTAKGGIVVAIRDAVDIPVKLIGIGETPDDVEPFNPETFVDSMFAV